jgi:hypothetical protein
LQQTVQPTHKAFRVRRTYPKILRRRKQRIARRLAPRNWKDQPQPMFAASNIHYEMAERTQAMNYGGIGAVHRLTYHMASNQSRSGLCVPAKRVPAVTVKSWPQ